MTDPTAGLPEEAVRAAAEALDEWLFRMHGLASSCLHYDEARAALAAALPALRDAVAADMRAALQDAIELAEDGIAYVSDYLRDKRGMDDELARLKAVLAEHSGGTPQRGEPGDSDTSAGGDTQAG